MKKVLKNKRKSLKLTTLGFTLVELMAVILILGVLALITYPIIDKSIKQSKEKALDRTIASVIEAAFNYSIDNDLGYEKDYQILELSVLKDNGFLKQSIINPVTNNELEGCLLYKWDSNDNQYIFEYSETCEIPQSVPNLIDTLLTQYDESNTTGLVKDSENENIYYYTGTNEEVTNNFLWYGGHQWRVLEFDTENKTLTLITQQPLTIIHPNDVAWETKEEYESSYINTWLNEYFWNSLDSSVQANVLDNTFNIGVYTDVDEITITKKVGLLDEMQYVKAGNQNSFLDIKDYFLLGNRSDLDLYSIRYVSEIGEVYDYFVYNGYGVRAVMKISDLNIIDGKGTLTDNYRVATTNDIQVGEYINVPTSGNYCGSDKMCTFRVVSKDNDSIKVILNGLLPNTYTYGNSSTITINHTIYDYLNEFTNSISNSYRYTENKTFYIGEFIYEFEVSQNYKDVQNETLQANVGLPTIGEMFSGNDIDLLYYGDEEITFVDSSTIENSNVTSDYWTMNRCSSSSVCIINDVGSIFDSYPDGVSGVRPVMYLKQNLTFIGGNGTAQSPYILK